MHLGPSNIPRRQSSIPHDQTKEGILNLFLGKCHHKRVLQILDQRERWLLTPSKFFGSMLTLRLLTSKEDESRGGGGALCTGVLERSRLEYDDVFGEE